MKKIFFVLLMSIIILTGCGKKEVKVETKKNQYEKQVVENFEFKNIYLTYEDNVSTLKSTVTNIGTEVEEIKEFKIHVKNELNQDIIVLTGFIGDKIRPGETKEIISNYGSDITNASYIKYEIIR